MKNIATWMSGLSLSLVLGVAFVTGAYSSDVDLLMAERVKQEEIRLEQRTILNEQKHFQEDLEETQGELKTLTQELREAIQELKAQ